MADPRRSKLISNKNDIDYFLSLKSKDINTSFMMETFGEFDGVCKYHPYDIFNIPKGYYGPENNKNKNNFTTTLGLFIFNKFFIEEELHHVLGYINSTVDDDLFSSINKKLSYALTEDRITVRNLKTYLNKTQKAMPYVSILSPNFTDKMLTCTRAINKKKRELLKKYKKDIEEGNELVADKMEKELLDYAKEYMSGDPSMDMYLSGARGSIGNNFKNIFVMRGVIKDPDPNAKQKYHVALSNYCDGITPEEYVLFANSLAAGPFARARKTATGGYWEKLFVSAFQHITLDPKGSDCGTTKTITVKLTKKNISFYMYSYIVEGSRLIELTSENMNKYIGKNVKLRYSSLCESKTGICNKCMGNLLYRIGIENVGVATSKIPSTLKNISMKSFHDSTQKFQEIDLEKIF